MNRKKIDIIVTGGSGLVGSALKRIVDSDTRLKSKYIWHFLSSKEVDLTDKYQTYTYFEETNPNVVIHLAGIVYGATSNSDKQFDSLIKNSLIHTNVFDICNKLNVRHIITCLSSVLSEDSNISVKSIEAGVSLDTEEHFGYKHSKRLLHALCKSYNIKHRVTMLCPVNIYGYDDMETSDRLIPSLYRKIRDGEVITSNPNIQKEFILNTDLARIIIKCLSLNKKIKYPIIIGDEEKISIKNVIIILSSIMGKRYKINFSEKDKTVNNKTINYNYRKLFPSFKITKFKEGIKNVIEDKRNQLGAVVNIRKHITLGEFIFDEHVVKNVVNVLKTGRLTYGVYSKLFEEKFAKIHGCKYGILSNSGTSSLQVAIAALKEHYKWNNGDEILVPAITFVASVNTIIQNNLKPVLVDAHSKYYNIDVNEIEKRITNRTRAIMVVHLFGQPCDMDAVVNICKKYNLRIIEDSCETMTSKYKGKVVGSFGDISCFSTYVAHLLVTGVGGFSLTNNIKLATIMRSLINHGRDNVYISIDDDNFNEKKEKNKYKKIISKRFNFERIGYSYRLTELESAIGLVQINKLKNDIEIRKHNAMYLTSKLKKYNKYLQLPSIIPNADHCFMVYPIVVKPQNKFIKSELLFHLERNNIETRDLMPITTQKAYINIFNGIDLEKEYPIADYLNKNGFYIGCHPYLTKDDINYIDNVFNQFFVKNKIKIK